MRFQKLQRGQLIEEIIIYGLLLVVCIWLLQGKNNFHIDEMFSYGLSNHVGSIEMMPPEEGRLFSPVEEAYYEYLTVADEHRFNYDNVWINQETDVHPPFYYSILHTICSFFPESFSIWYAGVINIAAVMLVLFTLRKILELLEVDIVTKIVISGLFIFSTGVWSAACFLRMYALTMFWVTLTVYIFLKTVKEKMLSWKTLVTMFMVAVCGSLTHYYYLVYLFFLCAVYFIYLVFNDRKSIIPYLITYGLAGLAATRIFPPMIFHMFEDYRGEESIENLNAFSIEFFLERYRIFKYSVDTQLFAGYFDEILVVILVVLGMWFSFSYIDKKKIAVNVNGWEWSILIIPCVCYFALVTQMAVYTDARYMIPIYAVLITTVFGLLFKLLEKISPKIIGRIIVCFCAFFIMYSMVTKNQCDFQKSPEWWNGHFEKHAENDCIYIHDGSWRIQASFTEMRNYKSIRFFSEEYFYEHSEINTEKEELLVSIVSECDTEKVIKKVFELYPGLNQYEEAGSFAYSDTFYFYKIE